VGTIYDSESIHKFRYARIHLVKLTEYVMSTEQNVDKLNNY